MVGMDSSEWEAGGVVPSYDGTSLVNFAAELEIRLTGRSPTRGLRPDLASHIPDARNYLLVVIDGLGDRQLAHPAAAVLARCRQGGAGGAVPYHHHGWVVVAGYRYATHAAWGGRLHPVDA